MLLFKTSLVLNPDKVSDFFLAVFIENLLKNRPINNEKKRRVGDFFKDVVSYGFAL